MSLRRCLVLILAFGLVLGEETEPQTMPEPEARAVLERAIAYLADEKNLNAQIHFSLSVTQEEGSDAMDCKYALQMEKPNRVALRLREGKMGASIYSDGEQVIAYLPHLKEYTVSPGARDLFSVFMNSPELSNMTAGVTTFLGLFFSGMSPSFFMQDVTELEDLGVEPVRDVPAHHLEFTKGGSRLSMWIQREGPPNILKIEPNMAAHLAQVKMENPQAEDLDASMWLIFSDWSNDPPESASVFSFTPPRDAKKVETLGASLSRPKVETLLGKKAPDFILTRLDGQEVHLLDHLGKDVVVLDFWVTWCGPCRMSLPELNELEKRFAPKGAVFYAINLGEAQSVIQRFLQRLQLDLNVLMDPKGRIAPLYGVDGVPYTVVIGKDGTVQAEHPGFHPSMKEMLAKDLEALLAGKNLVE